MATKDSTFNSKRKVSSDGKEKGDFKNKKPRLEGNANGKPSGSGMEFFVSPLCPSL
jgi:pumilio family protein 6